MAHYGMLRDYRFGSAAMSTIFAAHRFTELMMRNSARSGLGWIVRNLVHE